MFNATLQALDAKVDPGSRNLLLRATLDDSQGLLPGMFARLVIDLDQPRKVVTIPETAVSYSLHGNTVYVLRQDVGETTVEPRVVQTGVTRDGEIAVTAGLRGGEWVATVGQNKLYKGARVTVDENGEL